MSAYKTLTGMKPGVDSYTSGNGHMLTVIITLITRRPKIQYKNQYTTVYIVIYTTKLYNYIKDFGQSADLFKQ